MALALVASSKTSDFKKYGSGYKITTKSVIDCGFLDGEQNTEPTEGDAELVRICTVENLTLYKLDPPATGNKKRYALVMIASVRHDEDTRRKTYMVDRVQLLDVQDVPAVKTMLLKMHTLSSTTKCEGAMGAKGNFHGGHYGGAESPEEDLLSASPTDAPPL